MTLLRKCLLELRAHHQDYQMNELNGHDIEDLRPGMHATFSKTITTIDCNQAGQMLAALADLPQATFASKVEVAAA